MENLTEPLIGKLKKYKQAMYTVAQATTEGFHIYESDKIQSL
nr:hypothetical protein [uncultured Dysgonomonas sp.]